MPRDAPAVVEPPEPVARAGCRPTSRPPRRRPGARAASGSWVGQLAGDAGEPGAEGEHLDLARRRAATAAWAKRTQRPGVGLHRAADVDQQHEPAGPLAGLGGRPVRASSPPVRERAADGAAQVELAAPGRCRAAAPADRGGAAARPAGRPSAGGPRPARRPCRRQVLVAQHLDRALAHGADVAVVGSSPSSSATARGSASSSVERRPRPAGGTAADLGRRAVPETRRRPGRRRRRPRAGARAWPGPPSRRRAASRRRRPGPGRRRPSPRSARARPPPQGGTGRRGSATARSDPLESRDRPDVAGPRQALRATAVAHERVEAVRRATRSASSRYFTTAPSVASTDAASRRRRPSAARARAQSIVSATPGGL